MIISVIEPNCDCLEIENKTKSAHDILMIFIIIGLKSDYSI